MERLKGKTILIGKEPSQGRLLIAVQENGKCAAIGGVGSVPACVSRCRSAEGIAHARLSIDGNGNMALANMKPENVTFVNGVEIVSKRVSMSDAVALGKDKFAVSLPLIIETAKRIMTVSAGPSDAGVKPDINKKVQSQPVRKFDIRHLERVWDGYEKEMDRIVKAQQDLGRKKMLPIMVGSFSGVASPILATVVAANTLYFTLPVAAISFLLYFVNYNKKDTSYEDRKAANDRLLDEYVCPNPDCRKFLGNMSYRHMKKQYSMHCPYCHAEFVE